MVTLSRRELDDEVRIAFEKELRALGAQLHIIKCDITDQKTVEAAAAECSATLPPVRGVVHGGMVLRVSGRQLHVSSYYEGDGR